MSVPAGPGRRANPRGDGTRAVYCPPGRPAQLAERMNDSGCDLGRGGQGEPGGSRRRGISSGKDRQEFRGKGPPEGRSDGTWGDWKDKGTKNQQVGRNGP